MTLKISLIPECETYVSALRSMRLSPNDNRMLLAHYTASNHTISMQEMSQLL